MQYTFQDFINETFPHPKNTPLRRGQRMAHILQTRRFDLFEQAQEMGLNPFYDDAKIPEFLAYVGTNWDNA